MPKSARIPGPKGDLIASLARRDHRFGSRRRENHLTDIHLWLHYAADPTVFRDIRVVDSAPYLVAQNNSAILGFDGKQLWFLAATLHAYDPFGSVIIPTSKLTIPALPNELRYYTFDNERRLLTMTLSNGERVEIDPATRLPRPLAPDPPMTPERYERANALYYSQEFYGYYWHGEYLNPSLWFGLFTEKEAESARAGWSRPGRAYHRDALRHLYRVRLNERGNVQAMERVSPTAYLESGLLRYPDQPQPFKLQNPDSRLIFHVPRLGQSVPLQITRITLDGQIVWTLDTRTRNPENLYTGAEDVVIVSENEQGRPELVTVRFSDGAIRRAQFMA